MGSAWHPVSRAFAGVCAKCSFQTPGRARTAGQNAGQRNAGPSALQRQPGLGVALTPRGLPLSELNRASAKLRVWVAFSGAGSRTKSLCAAQASAAINPTRFGGLRYGVGQMPSLLPERVLTMVRVRSKSEPCQFLTADLGRGFAGYYLSPCYVKSSDGRSIPPECWAAIIGS